MKVAYGSLVLLLALVGTSTAFFEWIQCGLQVARSMHRCVKSCKEQNPCQSEMDKCQLGDQFLRMVCRSVTKCVCRDCLLCVVKCVVNDVFDRADCNFGQFMNKILKKLSMKHDYPVDKAGSTEALKAIVAKVSGQDLTENLNVTVKPESEGEEEEDQEDEFDDDNDVVDDDTTPPADSNASADETEPEVTPATQEDEAKQ